MTSRIALAPLVKAVDVDDLERGNQGEFIDSGGVKLVALQNARQDLQVLVQRAEHEQWFTTLQRAEVFEEGLDLRD